MRQPCLLSTLTGANKQVCMTLFMLGGIDILSLCVVVCCPKGASSMIADSLTLTHLTRRSVASLCVSPGARDTSESPEEMLMRKKAELEALKKPIPVLVRVHVEDPIMTSLAKIQREIEAIDRKKEKQQFRCDQIRGELNLHIS